MIIAVHQPQYLPWLGYFDKIRRADMVCFLDNVQYKKNDWQNRNRIKTAQGWQWLTVPVHYRFPQKITEVTINNTVKWKKKHLQALISNYSRAPFFDDYLHIFKEVFAKPWESLSDLNIDLIKRLAGALGLDRKPFVKASDYDLGTDPTDRLVDICKIVMADTYLSGRDGVKYMNMERFKESGIGIVIQDFKHPEYPQLFEGFQSHMSIVDLLFNCGATSLAKIKEINP
ncbi:hypothetical protein JY97_09290 [Alkalispirochaeta odontotermitis]|nr:hypothetical protein JY97_09290 [Alkalispirochaeta odontotermitis]CAB1080888.1 hypothetical protein D1AOALGA4SA_8556 [Olavius algarvensis Delta 1 endosymbiont]